jgi:lipopolysaccharide/colanic/teichoic acid biosynthesis glycosyltransferase
MISVLIMAKGSHATSPSDIENIIGQLKAQQLELSCELEILVLDLSGAMQAHDFCYVSQVQLIPCQGMRPAEARNLAMERARGTVLCFIDSDCVPLKGWLPALIEPFEDWQVAGVKGTYICTSRDRISRFLQLEHEARYRRLENQPAIDFIDMYSAAYRRSVLVANEGFDDRFGRLEEQELAYRLAGRGYKLVFQRSAKVMRQHPSTISAYVRTKFATGYWKAQVIRLYPDRGLSDSYTPQSLKLQIGALFTAVCLLCFSFLAPWFLAGSIAAILLFLVSTLPLMSMIWMSDRPLVLVSLPMMIARALALGSGYGWGIIRPASQLAVGTSPIGGRAFLIKRFLDIIGSLVGLAFTAVLAPLLALLIKIDSPGPVLFRQTRIGRGGQPFALYKFRTMDVDAELRLGDLIDLDNLEQPAIKLVADPRITRVGRILRRWSLDELPQFWNVLRGDMSLVGPRPEEARFVAMYSDWHRRRLAVKPGMTGPMQIQGRGDLSLDERVRLEINYIEEYTLWQDMTILANTIPSVLKGKGAR